MIESVPNFEHEVDARGLKCPLPILRTKRALADMHSGEIVKVITTDPNAEKDMEIFSNQTDNPIIHKTSKDNEYIFYLRRR
ncbi:MAG: sulfurtransferase TusA family protein [Pseudomonadota bacterium]